MRRLFRVKVAAIGLVMATLAGVGALFLTTTASAHYVPPRSVRHVEGAQRNCGAESLRFTRHCIGLLQQSLNVCRGTYAWRPMGTHNGGVDRLWGLKTQANLGAFQLSRGLGSRAIPGPHTWAALDACNGSLGRY